MRNYIKADLYRIIHKKIRWIILVAISIAAACTGLKACDNLFTAASGTMGNIIFMSIVMGVAEIMVVYGDDFKAKTMQIAIGTGLPRQKVVHAKWLEFMAVSAIDVIVYSLVSLLVSVIYVGTEGGFDIKIFLITMVMSWLEMIVYVGCVMFIMFVTQGTGMAVLVYLILILGPLINEFIVQKIVEMLDINRFHIESYFLYEMIDTVKARLVLGEFSWANLFGILVYMMISFALASILFKKKELEF